MELGILEKVELRSVWKNEQYDFSAWLSQEDNLRQLGETIGIGGLILEETESRVGGFRVDILANEEISGRRVIIENQLERTDHDHLGKLITYTSGKDAKTVIWVVKTARDEHRKAVEWLNENTNEEFAFFLVEIELWKIGDSKPAPKFNIVEQPNDWKKRESISFKTGSVTQEYFDFWQAFNEYSLDNEQYSNEFSKRKTPTTNYLSVNAGIQSRIYSMSYIIDKENQRVAIEIYIPDNKEIFDMFLNNKEQLEEKTNLEFNWQRADDSKFARVITYKNIELRKENWKRIYEWYCENAITMKKAFREIYDSNYSE